MNFKLLIFCLITIHCIEPLFQDNILIKILEINNKSNIMISPFSIYQALIILANGAVNETQKEILEVLFPYKNISDNNFTLTQLNTNFIKIIYELSKEDFIEPSIRTLNLEDSTIQKIIQHFYENLNL